MNRSRRSRTLASSLSLTLFTSVALATAAGAAPQDATPDDATTPAVTTDASEHPWADTSLPPGRRAELLVAAMTPEQKLTQLAMRPFVEPTLPNCAFVSIARQVQGIPSLGLPTMRAINGPTGVGGGACAAEPQRTTAMPTSVGVGASFDPELARTWGEVTGREVKANGHNVFLTPGLNLVPNPMGGRTYEYFGEDPYLTGRMGITQVQGIESTGVQATPKHFVANEQETERWTMAVNVQPRALNELQMLPFEMVVRETDPSSIMCAYPQVNGTWSCESDDLLTDRLRRDWGFTGYVQSDRGAVHSTAPSLEAGLALEFGSPLYYTPEKLQAALDAGEITWQTVDARLVERYTPMFELGQFEHDWDRLLPLDHAAHAETAQSIAAQGMVLMKNDADTLPLDATRLAGMGDILMVGPDSVVKEPKIGYNGPLSAIAPLSKERPILALREELASHGYTGYVHERSGSDLEATKALAARMDAVVVVLTEFSSEFYDRDTLALEPTPNNDGSVTDQLALVKAVAEVNDDVVVVLKTANTVLTGEFEDDVDAIVQAWYPGQQDGAAVADVLSGDVNPGAKMPFTWATREREAQFAEERNWPGEWVDGQLTSTYTTGLEQGYRWYQAHGVESSFPFGFGLSYTDFTLSDASVAQEGGAAVVRVRVTNTGERAGAEVPQTYLSFPEAWGEPPLRLVGFDKVHLEPGESTVATMRIDPAASNHPTGVYDPHTERWQNPDGTLGVHLGTSSRDTSRVGALRMAGGRLVSATTTGTDPVSAPSGSMVFSADTWTTEADRSAHLAVTRPGDEFVSGDWDGDGTDTVGLRRGNEILLWNDDASGSPAVRFHYGAPGEEVLVGDWDGDGVDSFAVRRGNVVHVRDALSTGVAQRTVTYGDARDEVYAGDFDGDGVDTLAVRRRGNEVHVRNSLTDGAADVRFHYGAPGEEMHAGDFDGDGRDTFVVRRANVWHVRDALSTGVAQLTVPFGTPEDAPLVGDWDGDGRDTAAVVRPDVA